MRNKNLTLFVITILNYKQKLFYNTVNCFFFSFKFSKSFENIHAYWSYRTVLYHSTVFHGISTTISTANSVQYNTIFYYSSSTTWIFWWMFRLGVLDSPAVCYLDCVFSAHSWMDAIFDAAGVMDDLYLQHLLSGLECLELII